LRARCLSDARRNGRTDLAVWRETGTVAQQETETLVRIGAQIRQSTPNRMRLSARRPLVAAEFGARGIPVRRAPQLYGQSTLARIPWRRASTHTGRAPQRAPHR